MALTLRQIRQRLGIELRAFRASTAVTGSTRWTTVDTKYPFRTNRADGAYTDFTGWWLFRPSAVNSDDQQRRVLVYDGPTGTLQTDLQYTTAPSNGEVYELWNVGLTLDELHECINQSLRHLFTIDRLWLVPPTDSLRQSFLRLPLPEDTQVWLTNPKWVLSLGGLGEPPKIQPNLSVSLASSSNYASVLLSFKRDRTQGVIKRVQAASTAGADGAQVFSVVLPQTPTIGNLLVTTISAYSGSLLFILGWTSGPTATIGNIRVSTFYRWVTGALSATVGIDCGGTRGAASVVEYQGVLPGGLDQTITATGTSASPVSGTPALLAQGDELVLAVIGADYGGAQFNPTNRFTQLTNPYEAGGANPGFHGLYERNLSITDLQERAPSFIEGRMPDPTQSDEGQVFLYPLQALTSPSAYVVTARRPLYSMARVDSSGQFGTKTNGLTADLNEVEGDDQEGLLDAIVAGAMVYAWERFPAFQAISDQEREQKILQARHRFLSYQKASQLRPRKTLRYREPVGGF